MIPEESQEEIDMDDSIDPQTITLHRTEVRKTEKKPKKNLRKLMEKRHSLFPVKTRDSDQSWDVISKEKL
jgi:hypothetical protein